MGINIEKVSEINRQRSGKFLEGLIGYWQYLETFSTRLAHSQTKG